MPSVRVTLTGPTEVIVPISAPTGRVSVTIEANAAEVWATADGTYPTQPGVSSSTAPANQVTIAGVLGAQGVLQPPLYGDHMAVPSIRLASAGNPIVLVEW
jgi:hypothetical protein